MSEAEKKSEGSFVSIEQIASPSRRPADQRQTLIGLGLNKMHKKSTLKNTPETRGMIAKVAHLIRIVENET